MASSPYSFSPTFDEADDSSWRGLSLHFTVLGIEKYIERGVPGAYLRFEARFFVRLSHCAVYTLLFRRASVAKENAARAKALRGILAFIVRLAMRVCAL